MSAAVAVAAGATTALLAVAPAALASSSVYVEGTSGHLNVFGGPEGSSISASYESAGGRYVIADSAGITPSGACRALSALEASCPRDPDAQGRFLVNVLARGGDDVVRLAYPGGNGLGWHAGDGGRIQGDSGDDQLAGSPGPDTLAAGWDDDLVDGAGGDDKIAGQGGSEGDTGLVGRDSLFGGPGSDQIEDSDSGYQQLGDDVLDGGLCGEQPLCPKTAPAEDPEDADLLVRGGIEPATVDLGQGTAVRAGELDAVRDFEDVEGSLAADHLIGDEEDNFLLGGHGPDLIEGGGGDDYLDGGPGYRDDLRGGDGDDVLDGGSEWPVNDQELPDGRDLIDGGAGLDLVTYAFRAGSIAVDLRRSDGQGAAGENDQVDRVEAVEGTAAGDQLHGDGSANALFGADGEDAIASHGDPGVGDLVDCGAPDALDSVLRDPDDTATGCERSKIFQPVGPVIPRPPPRLGGGQSAPVNAPPRLRGPARERSIAVGRGGRFRLRQRVECPGVGAPCMVLARGTARRAAGRRGARPGPGLAVGRQVVASGRASRTEMTLNAGGRRRLRREGSLVVRVRTVAIRGSVKRSRSRAVRLRRPVRASAAHVTRARGLHARATRLLRTRALARPAARR